MYPIRLTLEQVILLPQHVESVRIIKGRPIEQRDGTLMYSYSLDKKNDYPNALCHTATAAVVRYISGQVEVYGGVDRDIIWAAFNRYAQTTEVPPGCQPERDDEQIGPPLTVLEGYDIKLEVTGARPKPAMTEWVTGCPTFKIVSTLHKCSDLPQKVFKVLQDGWYLDYSIKVEEDDVLTLDDHQGLFLCSMSPESVIGNSTLLMAYTSYVEAL